MTTRALTRREAGDRFMNRLLEDVEIRAGFVRRTDAEAAEEIKADAAAIQRVRELIDLYGDQPA